MKYPPNMEPSQEDIQELRSRFFQKLSAEGAPDGDGFHGADLARVKNGDAWLRRFLMHNDLDVNESLKMMWESCEWRKKVGASDLTVEDLRADYLEEGGIFPHNRDKDGKSLLIFKCKKHVKGQHDMVEMKKLAIYWFERLERLDGGAEISIFFDMAECGLGNMDLEFVRYLISLFKSYYPYFLNYIIVFEMPWVLNAAFKIIKSWLPAKAVEKIKFVNKSNLKEFVEPDQALQCWGGNDDYEYSFEPEQKFMPNGTIDGRKVHFAEDPSLDKANYIDGVRNGDDTKNADGRLKILPSDVILFTKDGSEILSTLVLTNASEEPATYKIKTTSPEKFRVRPGIGILLPGASAQVKVYLQSEYPSTALGRDKFLIMCLPLDSGNATQQEVAELWRSPGHRSIEQHRLRCSLSTNSPDGGGESNYSDMIDKLTTINRNIDQIRDCQVKLQKKVDRTVHMQWLSLLIMLGAASVWAYNNYILNDTEHSTCIFPNDGFQ